MHEEPGFRRIGSLTPMRKPTLPSEESTSGARLTISGTTGSARRVLPPAKSIGQLLGVNGADELPTIYPNQAPQGRVAASVRTSLRLALSRLKDSPNDADWLTVVSSVKEALELTVLRPQTAERLTGRITAMLAHWFIADFPKELKSLVLDDWLREFDDVPGWALDFAVQRYFATSKKKPFPVDIKALLPPELEWARTDLKLIRQRFS